MSISRRTIVWGTVAAAGAAGLSALGWNARRLIPRNYPPSRFDDVLVQLRDRDAAARIGQEVLTSMPSLELSAAANSVRARLSHQSLDASVTEDIQSGRLIEAGGWVLPETFALLSALAARP